MGHPVRLLQLTLPPRALSFAVLGTVSGWCLGFSQWLVLRRRDRAAFAERRLRA